MPSGGGKWMASRGKVDGERRRLASFSVATNLSLDGFVDHDKFGPDPVLFRHWTAAVEASAGHLLGRKTYQLMQYWDADQPGWSDDEHAFAEAWRGHPKLVVSRTLETVGPDAILIADDFEARVRRLKEHQAGEIDIGGTVLAGWLVGLGLIDEYRLYYHPVVLGAGTPFFDGPRARLKITAHERIGPDVVRLTCVPQ